MRHVEGHLKQREADLPCEDLAWPDFAAPFLYTYEITWHQGSEKWGDEVCGASHYCNLNACSVAWRGVGSRYKEGVLEEKKYLYISVTVIKYTD